MKKTFYPIKIIDGVKACKKYDYNCLMMIWPPYDDSMAYDCLSIFKGDKFIYVGEQRGGCTGDDKLFDLLDKEWQLVKSVAICTIGEDKVYLYKRK